MSKQKTMNFKVEGSINVKGRPIWNLDGDISRYELPDGSIVRLVVGIEVEKPRNKFKMFTSCKDTRKHGFEVIEYDKVIFEEV